MTKLKKIFKLKITTSSDKINSTKIHLVLVPVLVLVLVLEPSYRGHLSVVYLHLFRPDLSQLSEELGLVGNQRNGLEKIQTIFFSIHFLCEELMAGYLSVCAVTVSSHQS